MKKLRWQLIIIFLTGLVVGILLLSEQPASITPVAPAPAQGGIYTEALVGSMQRLNPLLDVYNPVDRDVNKLIFSGLLRFDARGMPVEDLAESRGISKDGIIYNFTLRENARWHDGEPVTADDVAFTIDLLRQGDGVVPADLRAFWDEVEVRVLDAQNMQFILPEPFSPFLDYLTFGVLPRHLLDGMTFQQMVDSPFNMAPVGSGPYRFEKFLTQDGAVDGVVLSVFNEYYGEPAFIEEIIFRYYPDATSALNAYRDGEVQGIGQVSNDILGEVLAEPNLSVYTGRKPELTMILLNHKNTQTPFFDDPAVRKALLTGLNRNWIIDRLMNGQAIMANGVIFPGTWAYYDGLQPVTYDREKAVEMLKEAEWTVPADGQPIREKEGVQFTFDLLYPDDDLHAQIAESIQRDWSQLDIQVNIVPVAYDQLINENLVNREYQAALVDLNLSRSPDPDPYPFWDQAQATGGQNYTQWDDRNASDYIEQARVAYAINERARLYRNFQVVFNEQLPALPLYYPVYTYAVDRQVQGVQMGPLFDGSDRFNTVTEWFLRTTRSGPAAGASTPEGQ